MEPRRPCGSWSYGQGGYEPGKIAIDQRRELTPQQWSLVATTLEKAGFWSAPTDLEESGVDSSSSTIVIHSDGLQWIIEGVRAGEYHVADRWSPSVDTERRGLGPFLQACRSAFDTANLSDPFE